MKVAIVYDRVNKWGGAERVLLSLLKLFPQAHLYTSVYDKKNARWAKKFKKVIPSFLNKIPFAASHHEWFAPLMPLVFESFSFQGYDLVFSVTSEAAKGVKTSGNTLHICYCLTPTRYLWSGYNEYFSNYLFRLISFPLVVMLRMWDIAASRRPDVYIAISEEVAKRIKKYYKRDSYVVYPPLSIDKYVSQKKKKYGTDYFLVVSRLVGYKKIDLAIRACNRLGVRLKIIGEGVKEKELKKIAGPTVEFLGGLTDTDLVGYYKSCRALLFPGHEDFGLVVAEAQRFGKPVIAYKKGGAREIIQQGKTGELFAPQSVQALVRCIRIFLKKEYKQDECRKNSRRFSIHTFILQMKHIIQKERKKKL